MHRRSQSSRVFPLLLAACGAAAVMPAIGCESKTENAVEDVEDAVDEVADDIEDAVDD